MKAAIFTDLHLHPYAQFSTVDGTGLNSRLQESILAVRSMFQYCRDNGIEQVWFLGDWHHVRGKVDVRTLNEGYRVLRYGMSLGLELTLVAGNHDYISETSPENSLLAFDTVVTEIVWRGPAVRKFDGVSVVFVPWGCDEWPEGDLILGHLAVEGGKVGSNEFVPPASVPLSKFDSCKLALLGHYHLKQKLSDKVFYLGALLPNSFSDATLPIEMSLDSSFQSGVFGFTVIDLQEEPKLKFIKSSAPRFEIFSSGFVACFPQLGIPKARREPWAVEKADEVAAEKAKGNYVRVDWHSCLPPLDEDIIREVLKDAKAVVFNYEKEYRDETRIPELEASTSLEDSLKLYVQKEAGGLDQEKLLELGREITG